jgi:predicted permease
MDTFLKDLRFALRIFAKNPGFSTTAVLALALGIGANTAIFSVVNAVLIRPLPFKEPDKLVVLWGNVKRQVVERRGASVADYIDWRAQSKSFEDMAAYWDATLTYYPEDEPVRLNGEIVTSGYLPMLGIAPQAGRIFNEQDDRPGAPPTVLLGHSLWTTRFGGRDMVGKTLRIDGRSATVIGILPPGFRGAGDNAEIWMTAGSGMRPEDLNDRGGRWFPALARLKPGVSISQAQAEITGIAAGLERAYPATNEKRGVEVAQLSREVQGDLRLALLVILAAVGLVLLIACANVANLLLAQAEQRNKEVSLRMALGASRGRVTRQLVTEGVLLSILGGALGVAFSWWGVEALLAASPVQFPSFAKVRVDWMVVLFTAGVSILTGIVLGAAPAFHAAAGNLYDTLKEASGRSSAGTGRQRFRNALVVAEVALAVLLLIGSGLMIRSFQQIMALDPGFNPERMLTLRVGLPRLPAPPPAAPNAPAGAATVTPSAEASVTGRMLLEKLSSLPSVHSVAMGTDLPLTGGGNATFYTAEGQPPVTAQNVPRAYVHRVMPGFFSALGIPMKNGRDYQAGEAGDIVIVSENVAKRFWPGQDPIGKRIKAGGVGSRAPWLTIVGVVGETKYRALPRNPTADPDLFFPFDQRTRQLGIAIRTAGDPAGLTEAVRRELQQMDRSMVIFNIAPMSERVSQQVAQSRFTSWLTGVFSGTALLLAMIGIYGVMSYTVTRRTQEIGVRMALGATASEVLSMVVRQGMTLILAGLVIGLGLAIGLTRLLSTLLFGVTATDPATYAAVAVVLVVVALAATFLPARRATKIDPITALRYE